MRACAWPKFGNALSSVRRRYEEDADGRRNGILSSWRHSRRSGGPADGTGSGARTRRRLLRKGEEAADYLMTAGKDLIDKCEDLYERGGELVEDASHELSSKYRALLEYSKQAVGEAEAILRRTKTRVSSQ